MLGFTLMWKIDQATLQTSNHFPKRHALWCTEVLEQASLLEQLSTQRQPGCAIASQELFVKMTIAAISITMRTVTSDTLWSFDGVSSGMVTQRTYNPVYAVTSKLEHSFHLEGVFFWKVVSFKLQKHYNSP